jgi:hypothetical protein
MKFNKWTLGLAAVGAVSLASAVRADEAKIIPLQTTLANTTISGYIDEGNTRLAIRTTPVPTAGRLNRPSTARFLGSYNITSAGVSAAVAILEPD